MRFTIVCVLCVFTKVCCAMPPVVYGSDKVLEVLSVFPRGRGNRLWEPAGLAQRTRAARSETAALLGEQLDTGVSQIIWDGKNLSCLLGMLGSLSAPMLCHVTPWLCKGCALMGKGVAAAGCSCCQWIWPAP